MSKKDIVCGNDYWELIPDGTYEAQCIKYDETFVLGKSRKLFLNFKITELGKHIGKEIFAAFNLRYDRKIRTGSKYYKTWCMVNNWKRPSRNAKMSPRLFINKIYKIKTRTVKPTHNGKQMPDIFFYSVVDEILEVLIDSK
jgi:hypothetical protein